MLSLDSAVIFWILILLGVVLNTQRILRKENKILRAQATDIKEHLLGMEVEVQHILAQVHFRKFVEEFNEMQSANNPAWPKPVKKKPGRPKKAPQP